MIQVTELGYMGLGVSDLAAWKQYSAEMLALEVVDAGAKRAFLRTDYWHHRLMLEEDGSDDLTVLGFRVAGPEEFRAMQRQLSDGGVGFKAGTSAEAADRHVLELIKLEDPSGIPIEIFHGPHVEYDRPFHPGRRMHGRFKTGDGGLGHCIIRHAGLAPTYEFYRLLGMRGSVEYRIPTPGPSPFEIMFMHCNERDHTVAFGLPSEKRINHLMLEYEHFDDVGLTYEVVSASKTYPVAISPGRHANDQMYSFYFMNPSGFMCEVGWGARPATHQSEYYARDSYGHKPQAGVVEPGMRPVKAAAE
jgi:2,3-dihydroxyethylbenzene 1,2-dioxygenase